MQSNIADISCQDKVSMKITHGAFYDMLNYVMQNIFNREIFNMMHYIYIIGHLLLLLVASCAKQKRPIEQIKHKPAPMLRQHSAVVDGVECALCAQDVKNIFSSIEGISRIDFVTKSGVYEEGHFCFYYDVGKKNIDFKLVNNCLCNEGFALQKLSGYFKIRPFEQNGRWFVHYNDASILPMQIKNNDELKRALVKHSYQMLFVQGSIILQQDQSFFFMLDTINPKQKIFLK